MKTYEFLLTVAMSKRLIAKALMADERVRRVMNEHKLLIITSTTNAYIAQEALKLLGDETPFDPCAFRRGVTVGSGAKIVTSPATFDLLIDHGKAYFDRTVFDVAPEMTSQDMILKGANALHMPTMSAGVLIGHPHGGTLIPTIAAAIGRRVQVLVPVGVEKRVEKDISELCRIADSAQSEGLRLAPVPGEVYTELDALKALTGASQVNILASGGVMGAEGGVYFALQGDEEAVQRAKELVKLLRNEPPMAL
jgi:hypothetical protein